MAKELISEPRDFPAVEELLQDPRLGPAVAGLPRPIAVAIVREAIAHAKERLITDKRPLPADKLVASILADLVWAKRREIGPVINAAGILVHTNLGRAPLSESLFDSVKAAVTGYSNLEFSLDTGGRGSRGEACEQYLALLAEAEAATVVNNCAAALFLILNTFANRKSVVISRGELVQIGGGFRIPDILRRSGAKLVEVGTSNITTLADYEQSLDGGVAIILKVHKSNFIQAGFTQEVPLKGLAGLGADRNIMVVHDLGSGLVVTTQEMLGYAESTVQVSVRDGAAITCFSADKMFGGMQSGIIVGRKDAITQLKHNPLYRTVRVDKIAFTMLERLARSYLEGTWQSEIKLWSLARTSVGDLEKRAQAIISRCGQPAGLSVIASQAYMGGGALPEAELQSVAIRFDSSIDARSLIKRFRALTPPVIGRVADNCFLLDLKAVDPAEDEALVTAITAVLA